MTQHNLKMELKISESCYKVMKETKYLDYYPIIDNITYDEFFRNYLMKNQACLIRNISQNWLSTKYWTSNSSLNYDYLYEKYGDCDVTAYDCNEKFYNSQKTKEMKLMHYLIYLESYIQSKYSKNFELLYLKDWHLRNNKPDDKFYDVPEYFASDWLNEYLVETGKDDYRFVYLGPKGSWTPFHSDVFQSYSWSTNIFGKKKWILFPPGEENKLKDKLGNFPYSIDELKADANYFEVTQNAGDAIFVPSGWYHQVWNLEDTISINHNWINGCNVKMMWLALAENLQAVKKELDDCKTMEGFLEQCQVVLKASYGLDFKEFAAFITYIGEKRLANTKTNTISDFILSDDHIKFDLESIREVLELFACHDDVKHLRIDVGDLLYKIIARLRT